MIFLFLGVATPGPSGADWGVFAGVVLIAFLAGVIASALFFRRRWDEAEGRAALLQDTLDNLPGYIFVKDVDDDFRYLFLNDSYYRLSGQETGSGIGLNDSEWRRDGTEKFLKQDSELLKSGESFCEVESVYSKSGELVQSKVYKKIVTGSDGRRLIVGMGVDVTDELELEKRLQQNILDLDVYIENEQHLNRCLELISNDDDLEQTMPAILSQLGVQTKASFCDVFLCDEKDPTLFRMRYNWNRSGLPWHDADVLRADELAGIDELLRAHRYIEINMDHPLPWQQELAGVLKNRFHIRSSLFYGIWVKERLAGFICLDYVDNVHQFSEADYAWIRNIGNLYLLALDRHNRMNEIKQSLTLQKQIFNNVNIPIMLFDLDYTIISINPKACEVVGKTEAELVGAKCHKALCQCDEPPDWCPARQSMGGKCMAKIDFAGHSRLFAITTQPIYDHNGKMLYVLETAVDIYEEREQKKQLATLNLLLNNAAALAKISYFTGDRNSMIEQIGGAPLPGLAISVPGEGVQLADWIEPADLPEFEKQKHLLVNGHVPSLDMLCHSAGTKRDYRLTVRRNEYDQNQYLGALQDVTESVALANERQELIRTLQNYVECERSVNAGLAQIVMEDDFGTNVDAILRLIVEQLDAGRVYLGVYGDDGSIRFEYENLSPGAISLREIKDPAFLPQFLQWRELIATEKELYIPDILNSEYADVLREPACKTLLAVAVMVDQRLYGILGVGFGKQCRVITDVERNILHSSAGIIALAKKKQLQQHSLELLTQQNRMILSTMPISVVLYDRDRNVLNCNPAALEMFGHTMEEMLTRPCYENMCGVPGGVEPCTVKEVVRTKSLVTLDITVGERECQLKALPVLDQEGEVVNVVEAVSDVTDLRQGQRRLEAALKEAEAANRAKSYFLATMSHELRTPLNAVIGFSELLQGADLSETEEIDYLKAINLAGNSLLYLINDILDLSKLEAEQMVLVPKPTDLKVLLEELKSVFSYKARQQGLYFELDCPSDLPLLELDNMRLRQALLNIIGNAVKFTAAGGITVRVGYSDNDLSIGIRDTGIGIKPEAHKKIFEPFSQQDAVRDTHTYKGSGLGLAISNRLIACMNGRILLESEEGRGSTFTIELKGVPRVSAGGEPEAKMERVSASVSGGRALIVDDVTLNLKVLSALLARFGIESVSATSGSEALEVLKRDRKFDFVLTDMWMPEMNGVELAEEIRGDAALADLRIVAVTADTEAKLSFAPGVFTGVLLKPISNEKLEKLLIALHSGEDVWVVV